MHERLKARILKQAVEDNVDTLQQRLPKPLRPARRRLILLSRWTRRVAMPVALVVIVGGGWRWSSAEEAPPVIVETAPAVAVPAQVETPYEGTRIRRVIIDAGHGGDSPGTSSADGVKEKDVTLDIAARLQTLMAAGGFEAVLTRAGDDTVSLQQRAALANRSQGDIFVSIHLNWLGLSSARGVETYYLGPTSDPELDPIVERENRHSGYPLADLRTLLERTFTDTRRSESMRLAHAVQQSLVRTLGTIEPGLVDRGVKTAPFVVLIATTMPAILAEVSCLSNADEARRLNTPEYRQAIAQALATGVTAFSEN